MVARTLSCAAFFALFALPTLAETAAERFFPDRSGCYGRVYSAGHLASHPEQRVTRFVLSPEADDSDPRLLLWVRLTLRGAPGGEFEALAYCQNVGAKTLDCSLEGSAGSFFITPAKNGAILVKVGQYDMSLENENGFATLENRRGDDRSFILRPAVCG